MAKFEINKYNTLFFFDKTKGQNEGRLRVRIRWNKNTPLSFGVGELVELAKWSNEAQRCKANTTHGKDKTTAKDINDKISTIETAIKVIFEQFDKIETIPTKEQFQHEYNKLFGKVGTKAETTFKEKTLFNYFDEFVAKESINNAWEYSTLQKFATVKNHLLKFDAALTFETFSKDGLSDYVTFLRTKKDMRNSTILKQIKFLKWFLKWAVGAGYNKNLAFTSFSPNLKISEKKVIFLDWTELMAVYNLDFSIAKDNDGTILEPETVKALDRVRDVFCFCCFTSLRYSDVANLKRTDIKANEIVITTIKTSDTLTIDLNDYSRAILAKYANEVYPNNKALPVISNQRMNDHLKEVAELCGLDTPITITYYKGNKRIDEVYPKYALIGTHCGRRTFICNALSLGIAPQTVMKWTGHSDYKSMKPYIDIADAEKKKAMSLFNR